MTVKSLTYVEIDVPVCTLTYGVAPCTASIPDTGAIKCFNSKATCQDRANFAEDEVTLRFALDTAYLPADIEAIPSILAVSFTPATISLGENLGTRATLEVSFKDHPHSDTGEGFDRYLGDRDYDPYARGTFWGKFRARQPYLRGRAIRWITGYVGQAIADMETRHFVLEGFDGPTPEGKFTLIAKDVLKLADGDRAQAPAMNTGFIVAGIAPDAASLTLSPAGIGDAEYPSAGKAVLGGREIVEFTRAGDVLTLTARGQSGTTADSHNAQDRVQVILTYTNADAADIVYDLMVNYAGVPSAYCNLPAWQIETDTHLGRVYSAEICEPTPVATLISELVQQACLVIGWNDATQSVLFQVLRGILTDAARFTPDNRLALTVKEQPDKRISQVWTYFGRINPLKSLTDTDNYRSVSVVIDAEAEADYGAASYKKIHSRWIPALGRTVADRLGAIQLGRYRIPPRRVTLDLMRYAGTDPGLAGGYRIEANGLQDATGAPVDMPIQVTRINGPPDRFQVEAEEMLFLAPPEDSTNRYIRIDANAFNVNLRSAHDSLYPAPADDDDFTVTCVIDAGVIVGSTSVPSPALDVGTWPAGISIVLQLHGRIQGKGGDAGDGLDPNGEAGGVALYARRAIDLYVSAGAIWGGGGGGGRGGSRGGAAPAGGGGGAGQTPGAAGVAGTENPGFPGSLTTGGGGGIRFALGGQGGTGGNPGFAGENGEEIVFEVVVHGAGGAAGNAIDGVSYVTVVEGPGDIRGPQVN
jgi:hypothetical protein